MSAAAAEDHVGKGLACSITPTLSKITHDANEAQKHFKDISLLIFSTPSKVSNLKKREWVANIREKFGYELEVVSREEIITSLMMPSNAALCRSLQDPDQVVVDRARHLEAKRVEFSFITRPRETTRASGVFAGV